MQLLCGCVDILSQITWPKRAGERCVGESPQLIAEGERSGDRGQNVIRVVTAIIGGR